MCFKVSVTKLACLPASFGSCRITFSKVGQVKFVELQNQIFHQNHIDLSFHS